MKPTLTILFLLAAISIIGIIGYRKVRRELDFDIDWSQV
jgi:hypothetical protein